MLHILKPTTLLQKKNNSLINDIFKDYQRPFHYMHLSKI